MAKRRDRGLPQSQSSLNLPYETNSSPVTPSSSSAFLSFPRAASPSITGFLTKPSKWFSRPSNSKHPPSPGTQEPPRLSTSSASRRPTISGPTDPRPILPTAHSETRLGSSHSVLDLSLARTQTNVEEKNPIKEGLGDLRNVARKGWSRSVDDLGKFSSTQTPPIKLSDVKLSTSPPGEEGTPSPTKAMIEAYRRNSPHSPHSLHPHYPFPTIQTTSPTPSSSTPTPSRITPEQVAPHAHNRSFSSHAPFHPSRLASPSSLAPEQTAHPLAPSPPSAVPRNRTASSFEREREKDKAGRTGFTFPFSSSGATGKQFYTASNASTPSMSNSQIQSAPVPPMAESKRTSQIVHYSGFLNRHPEAPPSFRAGQAALSAALAKGWKPYKAILKGSKLYFYKPPSDRTVAIRELFPSGMDAFVEEPTKMPETVEEEPEQSSKSHGKDKEDVRKRRLYRGRATHPELVLAEDGSVAKGSSDALIHEAIFGTSFTRGDPAQAEGCWRQFGSAIVLSLPRLMGRAKFESEFIRYASYLISGADDEARRRLHARTLWLTEQYLYYQGSPADQQAWESFHTDTLSSIPFSSTSSQFKHHPPLDSPDLDAFSPRPAQSQTLSSFKSFSTVVTPPRPSLSRPSLSRSDHDSWSALGKDGLTSDVFLRLDSATIARSLLFFHCGLLAQTWEQFFGADMVCREPWDTETQTSLPLDDTRYAAFFGSNDNPHWLTRFVVVQILQTGGIAAPMSDMAHPDATQVSKTHLRSDLVNKWIRLGEQCRLTGDRCSWKAIEEALTSRPIARLEKVWRRVDGSALRSLQTWLKRDLDISPGDQRSPWGGDVRERIADLLHKARLEGGSKEDQWDAGALQEIFKCSDPVIHDLSRSLKDQSLDVETDDVEITQLVRIWQSVQSQAPPKSPSLNNYISQSLAAEPRQKGRFEPYHWQRPLNALTVNALVPLLFVEPLPTVTLIDREKIYRGKKESLEGSGGHPGLDETQVTRMTRMKSTPNVRRQNHDTTSLESPKLLSSGEMGGSVLRMHGGELLLLVPETLPDHYSRPPSSLEPALERRPSQIRTTHTAVERKTSVARRNSLPSLSQRSSLVIPETTSEVTLRVIVKAGTLDRLVDALVSGFESVSVAVADDNGEMPLREGRMRSLKLDRDEFRATWWSVFRSFVTPLVLFELLRKRFLGASNFALSSLRLRLDIYSTLYEWIDKGGGIQDALGDSELFDGMNAFFVTSSAIKLPDGIIPDDQSMWVDLENARQNTVSLYKSQIRRPTLEAPSPRGSVTTASSLARNFGPQPPLIDEIGPEALVDNLDALVATAMRSVSHEDFIATIDILEVQSADRTGWFLSHEPSTSTDEVEIQTIYSHLQQVEPSILISELAQESIYKLLPPSIRSLVRAHAVIRKWIMAKIVAPRLGLRVRQARMEFLLRAVEVCRSRMADPPHRDIASQQSVRSFVETTIISALVSPESRLFSFAWFNVAAARGASAESVAALLSKPVLQSVANRGRLTVDVGWLLERFLEVISVPNIIDSDGDALNLVNFDKRRHLADLVLTALSLPPLRSRKEQARFDRIDIDRLNNLHREVTGPPFDARLLRDDAYHESLNVPLPVAHTKKIQRPFLRIVQTQQEKCKRDKYIRERLLREKKAAQQRTDKREDDLNKAMQMRHPYSHTMKHQRSRRTMSSAFFHLMRPISSAFSSTDNIYASTQRRTAAELDFQPTGKPTLVISLVGANVTAFFNNVRLYTFHLTTEDGGRYLLQAATHSALASWLTAISQTAKISTAKRLTYIANQPKHQLSDHIQIPSQTATRHPVAVFGVDLDFLLEREAGGEISPGSVPRVLERCLSEIEARGLQEVGLYRIPGASSSINALRHEFDSGEEITFFSQEYVDIFAICDTVKTWFRSLPHPIFPEKSYHEVIRVMQITDFEERLVAVRDVVHGLPTNHFYLLRRICEHLERITDYEEQNHMTAQALAVLFNPTLLRSPLNDFGVLMHNMNHTSQLLQTLIIHFHRVFDETEADVDPDDDAEAGTNEVVESERTDSQRSSSVPTDPIHDHDPDLEPILSLQTSDPEIFS